MRKISRSIGTVARRRTDARLLLVSLAFVAAAVFLGLHALATPKVLLETSNAGFVLAVPVGLFLASVFAAWSALPLRAERARWIVARSSAIRGALLAAAYYIAAYFLCLEKQHRAMPVNWMRARLKRAEA